MEADAKGRLREGHDAASATAWRMSPWAFLAVMMTANTISDGGHVVGSVLVFLFVLVGAAFWSVSTSVDQGQWRWLPSAIDEERIEPARRSFMQAMRNRGPRKITWNEIQEVRFLQEERKGSGVGRVLEIQNASSRGVTVHEMDNHTFFLELVEQLRTRGNVGGN